MDNMLGRGNLSFVSVVFRVRKFQQIIGHRPSLGLKLREHYTLTPPGPQPWRAGVHHRPHYFRYRAAVTYFFKIIVKKKLEEIEACSKWQHKAHALPLIHMIFQMSGPGVRGCQKSPNTVGISCPNTTV